MHFPFYVYEHWHPDTGQCFYVGKGKGQRAHSLKKRNSDHRRIVAELVQTGLSVDVRFIATGLSEPAAYELEKHQIAHWRGVGVELSNRTDGGEGFSDPTGEVRQRISRALKGRPAPPRTAEHLQNISAAKQGKARKPESVERMRKALTGRRLSAEHRAAIGNGCRGKKLGPPSDETRAKMRAAKLGKKLSPEHREAIGAAHRGKPKSPEHVAKVAAALDGRPLAEATKEKLRASYRRRASLEG